MRHPATRRCWRPSPRAASSRSTTRSARSRAAGSSIGWRPRRWRATPDLPWLARVELVRLATHAAREVGDAAELARVARTSGCVTMRRRSRVDRAARERRPGPRRRPLRAARRGAGAPSRRRAAASISPRPPTGGAGRGWCAWRSRARPGATTSCSTTPARRGCPSTAATCVSTDRRSATAPASPPRTSRWAPAGTRSSSASRPGRASPGSRCTCSGWIAAPRPGGAGRPLRRSARCARGGADGRQTVRRSRRSRRDRGRLADYCRAAIAQRIEATDSALADDRPPARAAAVRAGPGPGGVDRARRSDAARQHRPRRGAERAARRRRRRSRSRARLARSGGARPRGRTPPRRDRGGPGGRARGARAGGRRSCCWRARSRRAGSTSTPTARSTRRRARPVQPARVSTPCRVR